MICFARFSVLRFLARHIVQQASDAVVIIIMMMRHLDRRNFEMRKTRTTMTCLKKSVRGGEKEKGAKCCWPDWRAIIKKLYKVPYR